MYFKWTLLREEWGIADCCWLPLIRPAGSSSHYYPRLCWAGEIIRTAGRSCTECTQRTSRMKTLRELSRDKSNGKVVRFWFNFLIFNFRNVGHKTTAITPDESGRYGTSSTSTSTERKSSQQPKPTNEEQWQSYPARNWHMAFRAIEELSQFSTRVRTIGPQGIISTQSSNVCY
jgi:hypothetical protein